MPKLHPYANESDEVEVGGLAFENRLDRVSVHGDVDLTRDREGLARARALKAIVDAVVAALEAEPDLPETVAPPAAPETVRNPFA